MRQFFMKAALYYTKFFLKRRERGKTTNLVYPGYVVKSCITDEMSE